MISVLSLIYFYIGRPLKRDLYIEINWRLIKMINTKQLRCFIGGLGMALPIMVLILSLAYDFPFPDSISATYYRATCIAPFMMILGAAGVLLMTYKGYDVVDNILNTFAGIFAWGICLFPCSTPGAPQYVGTF
jgi:hypothetical protein